MAGASEAKTVSPAAEPCGVAGLSCPEKRTTLTSLSRGSGRPLTTRAQATAPTPSPVSVQRTLKRSPSGSEVSVLGPGLAAKATVASAISATAKRVAIRNPRPWLEARMAEDNNT